MIFPTSRTAHGVQLEARRWLLIFAVTYKVDISYIPSLSFSTMAVQKSLLFLVLSAISVSVDSFAVRCPSSSFLTISSVVPVATTTCLFAEEENETEAPSDDAVESGEAAPAANAATDILSSPAFLKRKLEVVKSDIEATVKETEEARALAEAGKAEWGSQLDNLRTEVSSVSYLATFTL
jgi:hypothetical protein